MGLYTLRPLGNNVFHSELKSLKRGMEGVGAGTKEAFGYFKNKPLQWEKWLSSFQILLSEVGGGLISSSLFLEDKRSLDRFFSI